jgi:type II secretory pathway predicted ATPase ExeA
VYEAFFGLRSRPFNPLPQVDSYVALSPTREALDGLVRCVEQDRGIGVLTSPAGTGKSLVCRLLHAHFADQRRTVLLTTGRFPTRRALLQAILFEMKHPYVGLSEQEARLRLLDLLQSSPAPINRLLLIVDEAHLLSPKGHEELRTLTDYESGGVPYVSLVLAGQLELEEALAEPAMNALNQRVGCHVSLEPLTIEESYEYIRERLRSAGNDGLTIFSPEALYLICNASEGNPRRLNQLCDHCLLLAYAEGTRPVDASVVRSALLDLRELPLHWNAPLDLSATLSPNPLEAFAQTHAAEAESGAAEEESGPESAVEIDADAPPAAVYEVGGEAEPSAIDQLFQVSEFVVPTELRDDPSSFAQILREPLDNSLEGVTGAYETTPEPDQDEQVEQDVAVQLEDQLPAMSAGDATIASVEFVVPQTIDAQEVMPSCEPEEFVIEDTYAVIDRISESSAPHRLAAPVLPEMLPRPAACTPTEPSTQPTCTLPEEQQILDMVREMSAEVQQARNESPIENSLESEPAPVDSTPSFQSLREAMAWQFDVVEPESEAPAADPVEAPGSKDEARQSEEPGESSDPVQERRYAQLFTRLQKQRRRVEAVMNRERRPNNEARIS